MAAQAIPQTINAPQQERVPRRSAGLPWVAIFCLGLLAGWFVLGRVLLPASPSDAEPPQLTSSYQKIYLRLVAESFWLTQDDSLVQRALGTWDRNALELRLSQLEAETSDANVRTHLEALRAALDAPARSYTFLDFIFRHSTILVSATLPLLMFLGAGGVGAAPYVRDLLASMRDGRKDEDLLSIPGATQIRQAQAGSAGPGDGAVAGQMARQMNSPGAAQISTPMKQLIDPQPAQADVGAPQPQQNPQTPRAAQASPTGVLLQEDDNETSPGQTSEANPAQQPNDAHAAAPNAHTSGAVRTENQEEEQAAQKVAGEARPPAQPGEPQQAQSPVSAVAAALEDTNLPGELESLLADDIFGSIFDVDVLFDPFLKTLSSGLPEVDLDDLLRQSRLVALGLYGASRLSEPDEQAAQTGVATGEVAPRRVAQSVAA